MKKLLCTFFLLTVLLSTLPGRAIYANIEPTAEPDAVIAETTALTIEDEPMGTIPQAPVGMNVFLPYITTNAALRLGEPDMVVAAAVGSVFGDTFDRTRIVVELQDWWMPSYGHVHMACPVPIGLQVTGIITLNCRVVMHDNPGKLHRVSIVDESNRTLALIFPGDLRCTVSVCAWALDLKMDTTKVPNGWRELRLKTYVNTPDSKQMINSSGVPVRVKNGSASDSNFSAPCNGTQLIGRGWYTNVEYVNSIFDCVPVAPVKGIFTIRARAQAGESARLLVELDKSHFIPAVGIWSQADDTPGTVLFDKAGNFQSFQTITIDTTKLANGWHSLSAKSFSVETGLTNNIKNNEVGVSKFFFMVAN